MANDYTTLNAGTGGDVMDEEAITYGDAPTTRKRARVVISGDSANKLASVANASPGSTDYALVTRNIPSGTQTVNTLDSSGNASNIANEESIILLRRICKLLESNAVTDSSLRQKMAVESIISSAIASGAIASGAIASGALASGSIAAGAITTGAFASGAYSGNAVIQFGAQGTSNAAGVDSRFFMMDMARTAYNTLRSNLVWS
jgi:hypothetical protein